MVVAQGIVVGLGAEAPLADVVGPQEGGSPIVQHECAIVVGNNGCTDVGKLGGLVGADASRVGLALFVHLNGEGVFVVDGLVRPYPLRPFILGGTAAHRHFGYHRSKSDRRTALYLAIACQP